MAHTSNLNRREFLGVAAAATTFTIIPRHVMGGPGTVPPSDKINLALIGSGTQALSMLMSSWLPREELLISCVCDPNRDSTDYRDWSKTGLRDRIRRFLNDPEWGSDVNGIRGGREVGREVIERYYAGRRDSGTYSGCRTYADFRELLDKETGIDGVLILTPEHLHATIAVAAMNRGKHAISHKTLSNVLYEVRLAADTARKQKVVTHLLAWADDPSVAQIRAWIEQGAIGQVREVHNWSNRPVWPQGWLDFPAERPAVPAGFDWDLWLGPVPDRPYHPDFTHALFRGWYDFGSGCLGDMGNYSLWRTYRILDLETPVSVEATPSTGALVVEGVSGRKVSKVAFPHASTIRFRHAARGSRPAIDVWWYDGGIRPPTPPELYDAGEELSAEGMLFVGDRGKILGDFRGENPRLLSEKRQPDAEAGGRGEGRSAERPPEEWVSAILEGRPSQGSFEAVQPLAEAICLGNLAVRMGRRLDWDAAGMQVTNLPEANRYLRRDYRPGWEL